jgi:hypothetical protein
MEGSSMIIPTITARARALLAAWRAEMHRSYVVHGVTPVTYNDTDVARDIAELDEVIAGLAASQAEPAAYIEHHKGGDNLIWEVQKSSPRVTPLFASALSAVAGWQPIETAPKDGRYFLAGNAHGAWIAHWDPEAVSGYRFEHPWRSRMLNHWHMPLEGRYEPPTHWMPLPAAPAQGGQPGEAHE